MENSFSEEQKPASANLFGLLHSKNFFPEKFLIDAGGFSLALSSKPA